MHNLFRFIKGFQKNSSETDRKTLGFAVACDFRDDSFWKDSQPVLRHPDCLHRFSVKIIQDFLFQQVNSFACLMDRTALQQHQFLEARQYFLGVMADINHRRPFRFIGNLLDILQKLFFCEQIKAIAGLVQYQNLRFGHQSARDQNDLLLPLGQDAISKPDQIFTAAFDQKIQRLLFFCFSRD